MKERGILFSAPMVRALRDGTKTQTRRALRVQPPPRVAGVYRPFTDQPNNWQGFGRDSLIHWYGKCPYGVPGDRLWVREAWTKVPATAYRMSEGVQQTVNPSDPHEAAIYAAGWDRSIPKWKPSIHMPRWASRITLLVTDVRAERLQDISEADCQAEGIGEPYFGDGDPPFEEPGVMVSRWQQYRNLWKTINGPMSWDANPWVWAVSFERVTG